MRVTAEGSGAASGSTAGDRTLHAVASRLPGRILGIDAGGSGTRVVILETAPSPPGRTARR